jgi:S1-C subfamily serine protease
MVGPGQRCFARSLATTFVLIAMSFDLSGAQLSTTVRDRIIPAAVQISILADVDESGQITESHYIPVGSGTVVSPDGLILTNWHVVNMEEHQRQLDTWEDQAAASGERLTFDLDTEAFLILTSESTRPPTPTYRAVIASSNESFDLAVLRISSDAFGDPVPNDLDLPYVPVGNSDDVELGDPIDIFGYPTAAGDALTYTSGVVSGFNYDSSLDTLLWINTDATISGGSSGGAAVNGRGDVIGIPTQGSELDCRPGDTNRDGKMDAQDVGCIPVGGSIGQLRPINLALDMLSRAGLVANPAPRTPTPGPTQDSLERAPTPTALPIAPTPTASSLPHNVEGLGGSGGYGEVIEAAGFIPPAMAEACAVSPIYAVGDRVVLERGAEISPGLSGISAGYSEGWLGAGTVVEIIGSYIESGVCDHWPVRVVSVEDASSLEADLVPGGAAEVPRRCR